MKYHMSQAELIEAVQFYLNEKVLREPVKVNRVNPSDKCQHMGIGYVLHVDVTDDQSHIPDDIAVQSRDSQKAA